MSRTGHTILVNPAAGYENPAQYIGILAGCGADELRIAEYGEGFEVRFQCQNIAGIGIAKNMIAPFMKLRFDWAATDQSDYFRHGFGRWGVSRKVQRIATCLALHRQYTGFSCPESDLLQRRVLGQYDMAAGERCMAAERDFHGGGEPAQFVICCMACVGQVKSGLGKIIFFANGLQNRVIKPAFERHYCGLVAGKGTVGKSIDMIIRQIPHR